MSDGTAATLTVPFRRPGCVRERPQTSPRRPPRAARLLAFAHHLDAQIRAVVYCDLADASRKLGLTRARVTQITNLLLLAPTIQEAILSLPPVSVGRDPITERTLRPIVAEPVWERQIDLWRKCRNRIPRLIQHHDPCVLAYPLQEDPSDVTRSVGCDG